MYSGNIEMQSYTQWRS